MWEKVGCFKDRRSDRALPDYFNNFWFLDYKATYPFDLRIFFNACASEAKLKGYNYFGIQNFGECWGGDKTAEYDKHGKVSEKTQFNDY